MDTRHRTQGILLVASALAFVGRPANADEMKAVAQTMDQLKFAPIPGAPTCATAALESGDPAKGGSVIVAKVAAGCTFPWHWHTATEHVILVTGTGRMEMKDGKPATLHPGGYAMMPSHHVHQFTCVNACSFFLVQDAPFDIHYVDASGAEIPPDVALKAVKETATTAGPH